MADLSGQQFGDYRLLRRLGSGTFGEVYEGEQIYLKTHAAMKVLHAQLDQMEFQRFLEEARTIAALEHPHIVRVLSFSIQQHTPYLVMQLAQSSLKERFTPSQPQRVETILPYVRQAAEGLQHAHEQYIMHLDIKPANLLLTAHHQVLLADFGLALVLQTQRTHRTLRGFAGTPGYAAPEQFQNKPGLASDQYALGVMVYQWLVGMLPFEGDWWAIGHQKLTQDSPPLRAQVPSIPSAVEHVVLRALARDPKARFATVQDFATALAQAAQEHLDTESSVAPASFQQEVAAALTSVPTLPVEPPDPSFASLPPSSPPTAATSGMSPTVAGAPKPIVAKPASGPIYDPNATWGTLTLSDGKQVPLTGERAIVGRYDHELGGVQPEVDLGSMPGADTVTRVHASIEHIGSASTLTDLNSINATCINGKRLKPDKPSPINDGDTLPPGGPTYLDPPVMPPGLGKGGPFLPPSTPGQGPDAVKPSWQKSRAMVIALVALVLLFVISSVIYGGVTIINNNANATATATTRFNNATATARANIEHAHATATAIVQATAQVVAANPEPNAYTPPKGTLALKDPLNGSNADANWDTASGCSFPDGNYHVTESKANTFLSCFLARPTFRNFAMQVNMKIVKGDCGGIVFQADNTTGKDYVFSVCPSSFRYYLYRCDGFNISCHTIQSGFINGEQNQNNTIAVVANSSNIGLYINQQNVNTATDSTYTGGVIGVIADESNNQTEAAFSNLEVWAF